MDKKHLKAAGLKITVPRMRILQLFESVDQQHLSAEDIYSRLKAEGEDIGLATVYRVLSQFEAAGMVVRHRFEDGFSVYELDRGEHHDHLVCVKCRKVVEFVDNTIERQQQLIATHYQFEMTDHSLTIFGVCPACQG